MRVGIALGSNLGDRAAYLRRAAEEIRSFALGPVKASGVYETAPVDCPDNSPPFLNAVLEIGWEESLENLLSRLQAIEAAQGRLAIRVKNAPRSLDLDILYADEISMDLPNLELPHPRMASRAFVLLPLADIHSRGYELPGSNEKIGKLLKEVDISDIKKTQISLF